MIGCFGCKRSKAIEHCIRICTILMSAFRCGLVGGSIFLGKTSILNELVNTFVRITWPLDSEELSEAKLDIWGSVDLRRMVSPPKDTRIFKQCLRNICNVEEKIVNCKYSMIMCPQATHESCGELFSEYSSGQLQPSTHHE